MARSGAGFIREADYLAHLWSSGLDLLCECCRAIPDRHPRHAIAKPDLDKVRVLLVYNVTMTALDHAHYLGVAIWGAPHVELRC